MRIVFLKSAIRDLEEISEYIRRDNATAAHRVIRRIRESVRRLSRFPRSARSGSEPGTRELVVTGLPFVVVYRIVEQPARPFVEVIAVMHGARSRIEGGHQIQTRRRRFPAISSRR